MTEAASSRPAPQDGGLGDDAPDLVIRDIADMMNALRGSDIIMRVALLRQITQEPQAALSFGKFVDGYDVIDEMVHQSYQNCSVTYYKILLVALSAYGSEPRALEVVKKSFLGSRHPEIVELSAKLLSKNASAAETREAMRSVLHQNNSDRHARSAAMVLAAHGDAPASSAERVRMILLAPANLPVRPPLSASDLAHWDEWLAELDGPYAPEARVQLEKMGEAAVIRLVQSWSRLSEENPTWLLLWGAKAAPIRVLPRLEAVLDGEAAGEAVSIPLQLTAIEAIVALGPAKSLLTPKLARFLVPETDPLVRRAAIHAGAEASAEQWLELARNDSDKTVRLLSIRRYTEKAGNEALDSLIACLQSEEWDIRAVAADALATLPSEIVVPDVRSLMENRDNAVRVAAANVLIAHNDDDWLEETFIA